MGLTTPDLHANRSAKISLVSWKSKKVRRKASSSTLCEALNMSNALGELEWVHCFYNSLAFATFDIRNRVVQSATKTVLASDNPALKDPSSIGVLDSNLRQYH